MTTFFRVCGVIFFLAAALFLVLSVFSLSILAPLTAAVLAFLAFGEVAAGLGFIYLADVKERLDKYESESEKASEKKRDSEE